MVCGILGCDQHQMGPGLLHHLLKIGIGGAVNAQIAPGIFQSTRIDIAKTYKFQDVRVILHQGPSPEGCSADSGSHQNRSDLFSPGKGFACQRACHQAACYKCPGSAQERAAIHRAVHLKGFK